MNETNEPECGTDLCAGVDADVIPPMFNVFTKVRHLKTGEEYQVVGTPDTLRLEATNEPAYAYQKHGDSTAPIWLRLQSEMEDGRFVLAV